MELEGLSCRIRAIFQGVMNWSQHWILWIRHLPRGSTATRPPSAAALWESQQMLQLVMDSIPQFIFWKDQNSVYLGCNRNFALVAGLDTPGSIVGKTDYDLPWTQQAEHFRACDRRIMAIGAAEYQILESLRRADGRQIWISTNKVPLQNSQGQVVGILGTFEDITGRQRTAEILRQSEERYCAVVEDQTELICRFLADGTLTFVNGAYCRYFSKAREELLGQSFFPLLPKQDQEKVISGLATLSLDNPTTTYDHRVVMADGTCRWQQWTDRAIFDSDGRLSEFQAVGRDITAQKQTEAQLLCNAFHDPLTGLPNRALFMDRLGHVIARTQRHCQSLFAVLLLNLDGFKNVNDSLSTRAGDQLLLEVAQRLETHSPSGDTVARLSGDAFAILLEDIGEAERAIQVAKNIQAALAPPFHLEQQEIVVTASIGIALSTSKEYQPEGLLQNASIAMYRAKSFGRACYVLFDISMRTQALAKLQLESNLHAALRRAVAPKERCQEFLLHYQPIVSLTSGRLVGFEALVRWQHAQQELMLPMEFIPAAEDLGLILPLGEWVLREACDQVRQWQAQFKTAEPLFVSVNLSGKQLVQPTLVEKVQQILLDTGLAAEHLKLEITESVLLEDAAGSSMASDQGTTTLATLLQLKAMGIQLQIDDFGTGYSSLSYLHFFPVHTLKIDRSFINRIGGKDGSTEIVATIVVLAHQLGITVTAEGIETAEQLACLKALNCEQGQGYFFSPPLAVEAAKALIAADPYW